MNTSYLCGQHAIEQLGVQEDALKNAPAPVPVYDINDGRLLDSKEALEGAAPYALKFTPGNGNLLLFTGTEGRRFFDVPKIFTHWTGLSHIFEMWNYDNIILAGGVFSQNSIYYDDIDTNFFIYNMDEKEAVERIFETVDMLTKHYEPFSPVTRVVEISKYTIVASFTQNEGLRNRKKMKYVFSRRQWGSPENPTEPVQIVSASDIPSCQVYCDGKQVLLTPLAHFAWYNNVNIAFPNRFSPSFWSRLVKYAEKGFDIAFLNIRCTPSQITDRMIALTEVRTKLAKKLYKENEELLKLAPRYHNKLMTSEGDAEQDQYFKFLNCWEKYEKVLFKLGLRYQDAKVPMVCEDTVFFSVGGIVMKRGSNHSPNPLISNRNVENIEDSIHSDHTGVGWNYLCACNNNEKYLREGQSEFVTSVNREMNSDCRKIDLRVYDKNLTEQGKKLTAKLSNALMVQAEAGKQWTAAFHPELISLRNFYGLLFQKKNVVKVEPNEKTITIVAAWKRKDGFFAILDRPILKMILSLRYN